MGREVLLCLLLAAAGFSLAHAEPVCEALDRERFTEGEVEAIKRGDASYNALVKEVLDLHKREAERLRTQKWPRADNRKTIDWQQAKRLIRNGLIVEVLAGDTVSLLAKSGIWYETKPTDEESVATIVRQVDPCGIQIKVLVP
jgi:hypothetical protein